MFGECLPPNNSVLQLSPRIKLCNVLLLKLQSHNNHDLASTQENCLDTTLFIKLKVSKSNHAVNSQKHPYYPYQRKTRAKRAEYIK